MLKPLVDFLGSPIQHADIYQRTASFLQKDGFSLMRFDEHDRAIGTSDGDRHARKPATRPDIADAEGAGRQVRGQKQRFAVVALDGIRQILDAREVQNLVPPLEKFVMRLETGDLRRR